MLGRGQDAEVGAMPVHPCSPLRSFGRGREYAWPLKVREPAAEILELGITLTCLFR
jgi:hypothetical protein